MLYAILGAMVLVATLFVVLPLYRQQQRLSATAMAAAAAVLLIAVSIYYRVGTPGADSAQPHELPAIEQMVATLAERLRQNPDDLEGWKMLGRSYVQLRNFPGAIAAFEQAVTMENGRNAQTLADLGEVILLSDAMTLNGRAGALFENALAVEPGNQKALFYAGMAAVERGERELGAGYWERLLATSPPENIEAILRERIAELRGVAAPVAPAPGGAAIKVSVSLGDAAAGAVPEGATVFVIARDPAQPSPPIAAVRRKASELPAEVEIGDTDAMIPGRVPSAFAQLEIVARVSMSGQPIAQSGDWFGQGLIATEETNAVTISIDRQVP